MIYKNTLASVIALALIFSSLPPRCFAAVEEALSPAGQLSGPVVISEAAEFNVFFADSLFQQFPNLGQNAGTISAPRMDLAAAAYEAGQFLKQGHGLVAVEWETSSTARPQLKLTPLEASAAGRALAAHVISLSNHRLTTLSGEDVAAIKQLAQKLSVAQAPQDAEGALNELYEKSLEKHQGDIRATNLSATPISPNRATQLLKAPIGNTENSADISPEQTAPAVNRAISNNTSEASGSWKQTLLRLCDNFQNLPHSFRTFLLGGVILQGSAEGISIIFSIYGLQQFGLIPGLLSQATELVMRIPGSFLGARYANRFDAKKIYIVSTIARASMLLSLPAVAYFTGIGSSLFLAHFFLIQTVQGLVYGATRGMAESQIMPRLVGQKKSVLETAGFILMAVTEIAASVTALLISPNIRALLGSNGAILAFAGCMILSAGIFSRMRLKTTADLAQDSPEETASSAFGNEDHLPAREYIPYVLSTFLHFSFYSLFSGVFAKYVFLNQFMTDYAQGSYDVGSLAISLIAAFAALAIAYKAASSFKGSGAAKKAAAPPLDKIPLKSWFGLAALGGAIYLATGIADIWYLNLIGAAALGALTTVNRTKWMSYYLSRLKPERQARVIATLNSLGVAAALLPFTAISLGKILGLSLMPMLIGTTLCVSAALGLAYLLTKAVGSDPTAPGGN